MAEVLVNVGCGDQPLPGFVNLDLGRDADLKLDVRRGLPFGDDTVDAMHSEHFVEHLAQDELMPFLRDCRRALVPGGVMRVSTPDLAEMIRCYLSDDWLEQSGLVEYGYDWLANRCEMLNVGLREWGHKWVVDEQELTRLAELAGFETLGRRVAGESGLPCLRGLETRSGDHLIMEFRKPIRSPEPVPLVSVLIPAYNPRFFDEALDSASRQTWPNLEILVGDDSPGGEIEKVCRDRMTRDPRISYRRNSANPGEAENYNELFGRASGEFIKCLADDDLLEPACVETMVDVMRRHPGVSLVSSYRRLIDEGGEMLPDTFNAPLAEMDVRMKGKDAAALILARRQNLIGEPTTAMFRRRDMVGVEPTLMSFAGRRARMNGDVAMWLTLLSKGDLALLAKPLSRFRQHEAQSCRVEQYVQRGKTAWAHAREDAKRMGLWKGFLPPGGRVDADELDPPAGGPAPEISIVVPVAHSLPAALAVFEELAQENLAFSHEFIVVDEGMTPEARRYLQREAAGSRNIVMLPDPPTADRSASISSAVAAARGDYLVILDLDALPESGWLDPALRDLASQSDLAAVSLSPHGPLAVRAIAWCLADEGCGEHTATPWADAVCGRLECAGLPTRRPSPAGALTVS